MQAFMQKYQERPLDVADAPLVVLAEKYYPGKEEAQPRITLMTRITRVLMSSFPRSRVGTHARTLRVP